MLGILCISFHEKYFSYYQFYPNFKNDRLGLLASICFMPFPDMIFISHLIT